MTAQNSKDDLPRGPDPRKKQAAAIIDPRNDENLVVAQTHLAFIKFHNAVVEYLSDKEPPENLLYAARLDVVRHYQWIILVDYLPKIVEEEILNNVIVNGCNHFKLDPDQESFMPIEFSVGAYRLGHSLINDSYEWNGVFQSSSPGFHPAGLLDHLFVFTGFGQSNFLKQNSLSSSWII